MTTGVLNQDMSATIRAGLVLMLGYHAIAATTTCPSTRRNQSWLNLVSVDPWTVPDVDRFKGQRSVGLMDDTPVRTVKMTSWTSSPMITRNPLIRMMNRSATASSTPTEIQISRNLRCPCTYGTGASFSLS